MRILIVNDDGISSPVLPLVAKWAQKLGQVTVVAPKTEQSGRSQAIDFKNAVEIKKVELLEGVDAYAVDSTPADCVRFAVMGLKTKYDLILSGINIGYNLGDDIAYSGTIGAILEGARMGMCGIAISADADYFLSSVKYLDMIYDWFEENGLLDKNLLYNVNIGHKVSDIKITRQGGIYYTDDFEYLGDDKYIQVGEPLKREFVDLNVDIDAVENDIISVTPLTASKTNFEVYNELVK